MSRRKEREYGSSVPMQMRLDEIVWVRCTFGGPGGGRHEWKKREGRVGGRRGTEGETSRSRGSKIRLFRRGVGRDCLRLVELQFAWYLFLSLSLSLSFLVSISFSIYLFLSSACSWLILTAFPLPSFCRCLSRLKGFVSFPVIVSLSFLYDPIYPPLTLLRYHTSPPLSNLTRARDETRKRGATRQERRERGRDHGCTVAFVTTATLLRHCPTESLIGCELCRTGRGCILHAFSIFLPPWLLWREGSLRRINFNLPI